MNFPEKQPRKFGSLYVDLIQKRQFQKTWEKESFKELIFTRNSSLPRILINTSATSVIFFFWAKGINKIYKMPSNFLNRYSLFSFIFSLFYFSINEANFNILKRQFNVNNFMIVNFASLVLSLSFGSFFGKKWGVKNGFWLFRHGIHVYLYSIYFEIMTIKMRDYYLGRNLGKRLKEQIEEEEKVKLYVKKMSNNK